MEQSINTPEQELKIIDTAFCEKFGKHLFKGCLTSITRKDDDVMFDHTPDEGTSRSLAFTTSLPVCNRPGVIRLRLRWLTDSFITRPMTLEEVIEQLDVLIEFLINGTVPKIVVIVDPSL